jgi:uncharacterized protein
MENIVFGLARLVLRLPGCNSLKEKRSIVSKVKGRIEARHAVSIAEVGAQDDHGRAILALGVVSSDAKVASNTLRGLLREIEAMLLAPIVEERIEVVSYGDTLAGPSSDLPDRW